MLLSVLTAQLAGWMSARRAVKIRPVEALGESSVETPQLGPVRTLIGLGLLAGGLVMCAVPVLVAGEVGTIVAATSSLVLVIAVALLGPRIVQGALTLVGPVLRRSGGASGYLAAANLTQNSRRVAGAVVPLVLAITIMIVQVSVGAAQVKEAGRQADQGVVADLVVAGSGAGLSPDLVDEIRATPGVRTATAVTRGPATIRYTDLGDVRRSPSWASRRRAWMRRIWRARSTWTFAKATSGGSRAGNCRAERVRGAADPDRAGASGGDVPRGRHAADA